MLQCLLECIPYVWHYGCVNDVSCVLQCVAVCCIVLQRVAVSPRVHSMCVALWLSHDGKKNKKSCGCEWVNDVSCVLQCVAVCCVVLQCVAASPRVQRL